jgi:uncharacterized membrane protein (DUF2068 family)
VASDKTIRLVAYLEAAKGVLVLAGATGLLSLLHRDVYEFAVTLIEHAHLDPASKYPQIFLDAAAKVGDTRLLTLAAGAAVYATIRLVEAWGLYFEKAWAEVMAAAGGAIYIPIELLGLSRSPSWHGAVLLGVNIGVVALMLRALLQRRAATRRTAAGLSSQNAERQP